MKTLIHTTIDISPELMNAIAETVSDKWLTDRKHFDHQIQRENEIIEAIGNEVFAQLRTQILIAQEMIKEEAAA
jgi:hypothetical protein